MKLRNSGRLRDKRDETQNASIVKVKQWEGLFKQKRNSPERKIFFYKERKYYGKSNFNKIE